MTLNQHFLESLRGPYRTQLSRKAQALCLATDEKNPQAIKRLFTEIYHMNQSDRSLFVASMVNPVWTHQPAYSREHKI
jgi:hypothetical protein